MLSNIFKPEMNNWVHISESDRIVCTKETRLVLTNVKNKYSKKYGMVRKRFLPGGGCSLGLVWVLSWEIKTRVLLNCREISIFKFPWPKSSKNPCFHEHICIAYTNGPLGLEVTQNQKKKPKKQQVQILKSSLGHSCQMVTNSRKKNILKHHESARKQI